MTVKFEIAPDGKRIMDIEPEIFFEKCKMEDGSINCDLIICNLFYVMQRSDCMLPKETIMKMIEKWWDAVEKMVSEMHLRKDMQ